LRRRRKHSRTRTTGAALASSWLAHHESGSAAGRVFSSEIPMVRLGQSDPPILEYSDRILGANLHLPFRIQTPAMACIRTSGGDEIG
jgi:hypothetical protein